MSSYNLSSLLGAMRRTFRPDGGEDDVFLTEGLWNMDST